MKKAPKGHTRLEVALTGKGKATEQTLRATIARTHRVWPTCEFCGADLQPSILGDTVQVGVLKCPKWTSWL